VSKVIRVAVVDDHHLFRAALLELLATAPHIEIVGEAATGAGAVELAARTRPDVMLLDLDMPDTTSEASEGAGGTTTRVLSASPDTRIIILSMHDDARLVGTLVQSGAAGYLLKSAGRDELLAAIMATSRDDGPVTVSVSRETAMLLTSASSPAQSTVLTRREKEVLAMLAAGGSNRMIARDLQLAEATVKRHLATIYTKLGARNRIDAVNKARLLGAIDAR
jgi:DNA-binding NarL/FixJ family response regulator